MITRFKDFIKKSRVGKTLSILLLLLLVSIIYSTNPGDVIGTVADISPLPWHSQNISPANLSFAGVDVNLSNQDDEQSESGLLTPVVKGDATIDVGQDDVSTDNQVVDTLTVPEVPVVADLVVVDPVVDNSDTINSETNTNTDVIIVNDPATEIVDAAEPAPVIETINNTNSTAVTVNDPMDPYKLDDAAILLRRRRGTRSQKTITTYDPTTTIPAPDYQPSGLAYDGNYLYVSEASGHRKIYKIDAMTGDVISYFLAPNIDKFDGRSNPSDMVYNSNNGHLFISNLGRDNIGVVYEVDTDGTTIYNSFVLPFRGGAIAFDGTNLYINDFDDTRIIVTDLSGSILRELDSGLRPSGMTFDPSDGNIWVIDSANSNIYKMTTNGEILRTYQGPQAANEQGIAGITMIGSKLYISEVSDPDPYAPPVINGTIFIVDPRSLQ